MGIILALLSAIFLSLAIFCSKLIADKSKNPLLGSAIYQIVAGLLFVPFLFFEQPRFDANPTSITTFVLLILAYTGYGIFSFKANKYLPVSISGLLAQMALIVGFSVSAIVFKEQVTIAKLAGVALIIGGNSLLFLGKNRGKIELKGILLRMLASVFMGLTYPLDALNIQNFSLILYIVLAYEIPGILTGIVAKMNMEKLKDELKINRWPLLGMSISGVLAYVCILTAYDTVDKTIVVPINNLAAIFIVILGVLFLKETDRLWQKALACVLVFAGAVVLGLF